MYRDRKQQKLQKEQAVELKSVQANQTQHQIQQWATTRALRGRAQALEVVDVRVRAVEARLQTLEGVVHGNEALAGPGASSTRSEVGASYSTVSRVVTRLFNLERLLAYSFI